MVSPDLEAGVLTAQLDLQGEIYAER